jgi:hypothetical protein
MVLDLGLLGLALIIVGLSVARVHAARRGLPVSKRVFWGEILAVFISAILLVGNAAADHSSPAAPINAAACLLAGVLVKVESRVRRSVETPEGPVGR